MIVDTVNVKVEYFKSLGRVRQQLDLHVDISFIFLAPYACRTRDDNNWEGKSDPYFDLNVKRKPSSGVNMFSFSLPSWFDWF